MTLIRVVDLEATDFADRGGRVCQVGRCDVTSTEDGWEIGGSQSYFVDPGVSIPSTASAIHHITDEDILDGCAALGPLDIVGGATPDYLAGHSWAKSEALYLSTHAIELPQPWIDTYKAAMRLWPDAPGHSVGALRYELGLMPLGDRRNRISHDAGSDALVTAALLVRCLNLAPLSTLLEWSRLPVLQRICRIGSWRDRPWSEVDDGFLDWIAVRDFDEDVLFTVQTEIARRYRERRAEQEAAGDPVDSVLSGSQLEEVGQQRLF